MITDSNLQIQNCKNEVQLKLKLHQLWRTALWLSKLQLSVFLKGSVSLLNKLNSLWTVLLLPLCNQARPWFRFSTRTSSVAGLALCLVAFTRATIISCSLLVARTVQPFFLLSFDLDINTRWRIEILVFLLATERNQIRSVNFDPLLLETRGVFFLESISWNFSTFFSGRVRRLFSARSEFPYTPSINWSGYMRSFLGAQCWAFFSISCRGAIDNALNLHLRPRVRLPRWETFFFFFLVVLFLFS